MNSFEENESGIVPLGYIRTAIQRQIGTSFLGRRTFSERNVLYIRVGKRCNIKGTIYRHIGEQGTRSNDRRSYESKSGHLRYRIFLYFPFFVGLIAFHIFLSKIEALDRIVSRRSFHRYFTSRIASRKVGSLAESFNRENQ